MLLSHANFYVTFHTPLCFNEHRRWLFVHQIVYLMHFLIIIPSFTSKSKLYYDGFFVCPEESCSSFYLLMSFLD